MTQFTEQNSAEEQTILVVEDTLENIVFLVDSLESHQFRVLVAQDGEDAIMRTKIVKPDLILMDVRMPGIDGFETCRRLKSSTDTKDIPIIFMTALSDVHEKIIGFNAGGVDYITKPFQMEEVIARVNTHLALRKRTQELMLALTSLRHTQEQLIRSNADLEQLAYVASHDLQEPLRTVVSYLQLLEQRYHGRLDADADDFIRFAIEGAKRMKALTADLLAYSRLDTQSKPRRMVDCQVLVETVALSLASVIKETNAQISFCALPKVMGDETQLAQLFQNLLSNAIKFRGENAPRIQIRAESEAANWHFTVQDNGIGIAPENFECIFLMFQRLHHRKEYPGNGIGLALCKKIVERHGGRIWVDSSNTGTIFHFTLPQSTTAA